MRKKNKTIVHEAPSRHKTLIFIVAYNAQSTLSSVLERIPQSLFTKFDTEILIIDHLLDTSIWYSLGKDDS